MRFEISPEDSDRIDTWLREEVFPPIVAEQKNDPSIAHFIVKIGNTEYPYDGAIGGGLTYRFTPTSLGIAYSVTYAERSKWEKTLDLTDYASW